MLRKGLPIMVAVACLLAAAAGTRSSAGEAAPSGIIPEAEVAMPKMLSMFQAAFMKCSIDSDGDLRIEEDGMKTFLRLDTDKKLITLFSLWPLKKSVPELSKLQFVNRLNSKLIYVRFYMLNADTMCCDYQLSYENGVPAFSVVQAYRTYARVVKGAMLTQDPDNIVGREP